MPRRPDRRLGAACLCLVLLLTGCTYSAREPGLFGRSPTPSSTETSGQSFVFDVDAVLVSGSFTSVIWTAQARSSGAGWLGTAHPQIRRSGVGPGLRARTATAQPRW